MTAIGIYGSSGRMGRAIAEQIAAAGATHAVSAGTNDFAEYRGYCLFLGVYAVILGHVAYATYDHVFDD